MVLKRHKMNSPNFKVYSTIYICPCADQMGEVVDPDKQNYSIPLYEFSGSSHAVKSINFVAIYPGTFKIQKGNYHYQLTE